MGKAILKVDGNPLLYSKQNLAFQLSVLQTSDKNIMPWLIGKFANLVYNPESYWNFDLCKPDFWFTKEKVFFKSHFTFDTQLPQVKLDILQLIREYISYGHYITGDFDTYYVGAKAGYQKYHQMQDYLIFGYDDDNEQLYCIGYTTPFTYEIYKIRYSDYLEAVWGRSDKKFNINTIKENPEFSFTLNAAAIRNGAYDFINSVDQSSLGVQHTSREYGLKCLERFGMYLNNVGLYYEYIDRRYYSVIRDYAIMLCERLKYLNKIHWIEDAFCEVADALEGRVRIFVVQCESYNREKSSQKLAEIINNFCNIVETSVEANTRLCQAFDM